MSGKNNTTTFRSIMIWTVIIVALVIPIIAAAFSPQLQWRSAVYIIAGFAGIAAMALLLLQPLAIGRHLPNLSPRTSRNLHKWTGIALTGTLIIHVVGLYITSPPDVIDALLYDSPTPFSAWGVTAMWAVFITALLAATRKRFRISPKLWRMAHKGLASVIVVGTIMHAYLIQGTMEFYSKIGLSALLFLASANIIFGLEKRFLSK